MKDVEEMAAESNLLQRCVWALQWMLSHFADPPQFGPVLPTEDVRKELEALQVAYNARWPQKIEPEG